MFFFVYSLFRPGGIHGITKKALGFLSNFGVYNRIWCAGTSIFLTFLSEQGDVCFVWVVCLFGMVWKMLGGRLLLRVYDGRGFLLEFSCFCDVFGGCVKEGGNDSLNGMDEMR